MLVGSGDVVRMRSQLFFDEDGSAKLSRFWLLLSLAAVIASAGVVADSVATVIGAMIVAPLMTPILGIALAATLADRPNLLRSIALVVAGAAVVIAIGWLLGALSSFPVVAAENTQVAGRVSPRLVDLVAALATGAVGAVALCRSDVSDTLPGVAVAISLVPPLTVVGLTLESGAPSESLGALLLFLTNVSAILAMGTVVMAVYRVQDHAASDGRLTRIRAAQVVTVMVLVVVVPLGATSVQVARSESTESQVRTIAETWSESEGWEVVRVSTVADAVEVTVSGPEPAPDTEALRSELDGAGLNDVIVDVELVPSTKERI